MAEDRNIETSEPTAGTTPGAGDKKWSRQEAEHFQGELLKKGESLLSEQKGTVAKVLNGIANAMDKSAPHFEEEGQPNTARYTRKAAESIHGFAHDLRERDMDSLKRQVTDLARRQPGLVAGGAVALGFVASRFFRSSAEHTEQEYREGAGTREDEETLIVGTQTGYRSDSSPIITTEEFKEEEKEFPQ